MSGEHDHGDDAALDRIGPGWDGVRALVELGGARPVAADGLEQLSRRGFFKLAGAGAAAAGLAACSSRPAREILPYAHQPPELTPGIPQHYATALVEDGLATGVLVASQDGHPIKLEGNPDHPASLGATRAIEQAAVLSLFDPDRLREVTDRGAPAPWSAVEQLLDAAATARGEGLHVVLEPTSSPMVIERVERLRAALPAAGVTFWSPFAIRASLAGNRLAFGRLLQTQLDLRAADVIVALDADLVADHPMALAHARQISDRRRVLDGHSAMSRIYAVEPSYTPTGVIADHRLRVRGSQIERVAVELLAAVLHASAASRPAPATAAAPTGRLVEALAQRAARTPGEHARWIAAAAEDLVRAAGRSVVAVGERQPPVVHAIGAAINHLLGNPGRTVGYTEPVVFEAGGPSHDLAALVGAIDRGSVTRLIVLGGNPVYSAPAELGLGGAIARVATSLYVGLYANETAQVCRYAAPGLHELEQWGMARAHDGTLTPIQPLIEPLFGGRSALDVLHRLLGDPPAAPRDRILAAWQRVAPGTALEPALALGAVRGSALPHAATALAWDSLEPAIAAAGSAPLAALELAIRPHPFVHDGRYTNNPWLLELPEPITKLTWDHAAQISPATATRLGVGDGDVIALAVGGGAIDAPAIIVPGHVDDAITLHAGFGRTGGERACAGIGGNAFRLWTTATGWYPAVTATLRGTRRALAITQIRATTEDRPIVLTGALAQLRGEPFRAELARHRGAQPSLYRRFPAAGAQWAMSIDLTTCTGCTACVMACAAENNTPVVGKRQVQNGRAMHWLRIDRYYLGGDAPVATMQPMACQHCELAPCEYVCPVGATTHSPDGLNEMVYNRCIGTRFCSNNCPYKVRRFNWFDFKEHGGLRTAARNPDVTVRDRGVMEKCTYCVQRIRRAEIDARIADRPLGRDDVRTACQQACPAGAIAFGSITDPDAQVTEQRRRPHSYAVLHDQGTAPRTHYLARIRNPNEGLT